MGTHGSGGKAGDEQRTLGVDTECENHCTAVTNLIKHFTLINYDSRVVIWGIFQSGTTLEL